LAKSARTIFVAAAQAGDTLLKFTQAGKFIFEFGRRGSAVAGNQQN
jgi:hypothetical protein